MSKTVLLITYAWPPAGGPGVQRMLKFAKYLPAFGWQPLVLTVKDGTFAALDQSLREEVPDTCRVFEAPSLEPAALYKRFVGIDSNESIPIAVLAEPNPSTRKRIANWVRLNLFVPDAKIGWLPGAIATGSRIIKEHAPSVIVSSGPPPTAHLVARWLSRRSKIPWVADFRDPWTDVHYYEGKRRSAWTQQVDERLERGVLGQADRVVFVSRSDLKAYSSSRVEPGKCCFIPNGYDEADFEGLATEEEPPPEKTPPFRLLHVGGLGAERTPTAVFRALTRLRQEGVITPKSFRLRLVGNVQESVLEAAEREGAADFVETEAYLPHRAALGETLRASGLLLLITQSQMNARILPGKTFEYLRTGRPILALGPPGGEVDQLLHEVGNDPVVPYDDTETVIRTLRRWITAQNPASPTASPNELEAYSRKALTGRLAEVLTHLAVE